MSISDEISQLIKGKIVIRHRNGEELSGGSAECMICSRRVTLPPGSVCLVVNDEGLICTVCGDHYAPHMMALLESENNVTVDKSASYNEVPIQGQGLSNEELATLEEDIRSLLEVTDNLSRGVARGIIEAPAGHIGLMHYAKDIRRPPQREHESEKDYEMRVRTFRITRLFEKIHADTTERVERIQQVLAKLGIRT